MYIFKGPFIKSKEFCPNPIIRYGVPPYADSIRNPKVKDTLAWQQYWEQEVRYCIHGYNTGGMHLPGPYYKFLNYDVVSTVGKGNHPPDFIDFQYEFFMQVQETKRNKRGIISLKARRKGLSEMVCSMMDSGYRFRTGYKAGICAGLDKHADSFKQKLNRTINIKVPEFRIRTLKDKSGTLIAGWRQKENGIWVEHGSKNTIFCETMFENPAVFKGEYLDDCVFEEGGEFVLLQDGFNATEPCFRDGEMMVGTPFVYGTGGNMSKGSKAFAAMWHEADSLKLDKFFVSAAKMYFPCVANYKDKDGYLLEDIPYLKKLYKPHERIGMSDEKRAEEKILADRVILKKKKNKKTYYENLQNFPLTERESFLKFSGNNFDSTILNENLYNLAAKPRQYGLYVMEWVRNENGTLKNPLQVKAIPIQEDADKLIDLDDKNYVMIYRHPMPHIKNLDIAGIDSYDMDKSNVSNSLGAMVVYRRNHDIMNLERNLPICLIRNRPARKEYFYENCLMVSIYYGLKGNVLIDAGAPLIIDYFEKNGGAPYLAPRPIEFDSPESQQNHNVGVKFTTFSKPKMLGIMQTEIVDHSQKWVFPQLNQEGLDYDVTQKESDWDAFDAFGIAKMRDIDMHATHRIEDESKKPERDPYAMPYWVEDINGNMVDLTEQKRVSDELTDPFLRQLAAGYFRN